MVQIYQQRGSNMLKQFYYEVNTKIFLGWTKAEKIIVGALTALNFAILVELLCGL